MGLQEHIAAGKSAVLHCRQKYVVGASNKPEENLLAQHQGINLHNVTEQQRRTYAVGANQTWFDKVAEVAEGSGVGRCFEQAVSAFEYIRWNHEALHCAVLQPQSGRGRWNHSFAVIGASSLRPGQRIKLKRDHAPSDWPGDAVICDPWLGASGKVFQASDSKEWEAFVRAFTYVTVANRSRIHKFDWFEVEDAV